MKGSKYPYWLGLIIISVMLVLVGMDLTSMRPFWQDGNIIQLPLSYIPPFEEANRILGTDNLGRDMVGLLIKAAGNSLLIGIGASLLAMAVGVVFGVFVAMCEKSILKVSMSKFLSFFVPLMFLYPWLNAYSLWTFSTSIFLAFVFIILFWAGRKFNIASFISTCIQGIADSLHSMPFIMIIILVFTFFKASIVGLILVLGLTRWVYFYRMTNTALSNILEEDFVVSARLSGLPLWRIFLNHLVPFITPILLSHWPVSVAGMIMSESLVHFLGLGLPPDFCSWGGLIRDGMVNPYAWWVVVWPSTLLIITGFSLHFLSSGFVKDEL